VKQRETQHFCVFAMPNNFLQTDAKAEQSVFPKKWFRAAEDYR
jgi:hypothetical protein